MKGRLLGILEAKKASVDPRNVLEQAKRYAAGCKKTIGAWNGFKAPFLYASNGRQIWFVDVRDEKHYARELLDFHNPDAMDEMFGRDPAASKDWLKKTPNELAGLRPYQTAAIASVETGLIENKRRMMLAMATGTGKTFTAVSLVYRLLKSKFAKRVLFLVDRRALAAQAAQAFSAFKTPSGNKFNQEYEVFSQRFK